MESNVVEKVLNPKRGFMMLGLEILLLIAFIGSIVLMATEALPPALSLVTIIILITMIVILPGFKVVSPNEAVVLLLFGKYHGSIKKDGFFWVNPFCVSFNPTKKSPLEMLTQSEGDSTKIMSASTKKVSLKAITLNNAKQKVNDEEGDPIEIGVVVTWRVADSAKAVFNVENYMEFVSLQADAAIRHVARSYPYDINDAGGDEKSLRGSTQDVANDLKNELNRRVEIAGVEILEARISHLAYAPEIASAMLQRQQARAIIVARQKIVEGAVGMVDMALKMLNEGNIVELDDERKAQMVSNLLVVLCGNKDAQPIVNSGTIY